MILDEDNDKLVVKFVESLLVPRQNGDLFRQKSPKTKPP